MTKSWDIWLFIQQTQSGRTSFSWATRQALGNTGGHCHRPRSAGQPHDPSTRDQSPAPWHTVRLTRGALKMQTPRSHSRATEAES